MKKPIKVAIIDDHPMVITGIQNMLASRKDIEMIATYESGEALLNGLKQQQPDVLLLDIQLPGIKGDELAEMIREQWPSVKILAMTGFDTPFYVRNMFEKGCLGYLLKNTGQATLIHAIETVNKGETYIDEALKEQLLQHVLKIKKTSVPGAPPVLTRREKDILRLIVQEYTSQEIADTLFLSLRTIEKYRLNMLQKLHVRNTAGLVKAAISMGLTE